MLKVQITSIKFDLFDEKLNNRLVKKYVEQPYIIPRGQEMTVSQMMKSLCQAIFKETKCLVKTIDFKLCL